MRARTVLAAGVLAGTATLLLGSGVAQAHQGSVARPVVRDTADVFSFADGVGGFGGWSTLARTPVRGVDAISMRLVTPRLAAGTAVTAWWVIFNNPGACRAGDFGLRCGAGDLGNPAVKASVQLAAGKVIGSDGIGSFSARLKVGDKPACASPSAPCSGLLAVRGADIHLVVRTHGPLLPALKSEQLGSLNGGCLPGEANVGQCKNVQFSPHESGISPVRAFVDGGDISPDAWSRLTRTESGFSLGLYSSELAQSAPYTVWWVIFNNPSACTIGEPLLGLRCGAKDLANPAVKASVQLAAGTLSTAVGGAAFSARVAVGDKPACASSSLPCNGLLNPRGADVHIVVRAHGPLIAALKDEQLGSLNGGCLPGEANVGQCKNVQFSPHESTSTGV